MILNFKIQIILFHLFKETCQFYWITDCNYTFFSFSFIKIPDSCYGDKICFQKLLQITIAGIIRFVICFVWSIIYIYITELFPTTVRNLALGFSSSAGTIGSTAAPYVKLICLRINLSSMVPLGFIGIAGLVCLIPLKETKGEKLIDQIEELNNQEDDLFAVERDTSDSLIESTKTHFLNIYFKCINYATLDPMKIQSLKQNNYDLDIITYELLHDDWELQTNKNIYEEIQYALRIFDIDQSLFYIEFIMNIDIKTIKKLNDNCEKLRIYHVQKSEFQPEYIGSNGNDMYTFYGFGILREFIEVFQIKYRSIIKSIRYLSLGYSIIKIVYILVYKQAYIINTIQDCLGLFILLLFLSTLHYLQCNTFHEIIFGIVDMKRKVFMMEQLAFLISPRKIKSIDSDKIFPTINIFKGLNLKGWLLLRQVCQEYGKKYEFRQQYTFQGVFVMGMVGIISIALQFFEIFKMDEYINVLIIFDTCLVFIILIIIFYYGAYINSMYDLHDFILNQNKIIVQDICRLKNKYFESDFKSSNFIYSKAIQKINQEIKNLQNIDIQSYLNDLVLQYNQIISELQFLKENNAFKIINIKATFNLLEKCIVGISSIAITFIGKYLSENYIKLDRQHFFFNKIKKVNIKEQKKKKFLLCKYFLLILQKQFIVKNKLNLFIFKSNQKKYIININFLNNKIILQITYMLNIQYILIQQKRFLKKIFQRKKIKKIKIKIKYIYNIYIYIFLFFIYQYKIIQEQKKYVLNQFLSQYKSFFNIQLEYTIQYLQFKLTQQYCE
ncbi:major facilitator superfamily protein, putative [Ichthyophthirius multifiliis]|uniref:Major facilitator superfamily protein, putative n=1 Tax=Ichthyophthirius multifiliis TaxID=5932 RepID=G0R5C5_ICHMU|nr:major facilitator superfamily protein, putative [Ichthyophthirius multifiliis]EGR27314.1 major facilitator superfamily protein, putative [Ichthyophthirius multifiliis]|eukprot:XP_004024198.1 major facilitator superfamily protein, putative [Ichthyophthirius multifiliis]